MFSIEATHPISYRVKYSPFKMKILGYMDVFCRL